MFWAVMPSAFSQHLTVFVRVKLEFHSLCNPHLQNILSFNLIIIHPTLEWQGFDLSLPQRIPTFKYVNMICVSIYIMHTLSYNHRHLVGLERGNKNITFRSPLDIGCLVRKSSSNLDHLLKQDLKNRLKPSVKSFLQPGIPIE